MPSSGYLDVQVYLDVAAMGPPLQAGAYSNSSDTLVAGSRLLSVIVSAAPERVMLVLQKSDVQHVMRQVRVVFKP